MNLEASNNIKYKEEVLIYSRYVPLILYLQENILKKNCWMKFSSKRHDWITRRAVHATQNLFLELSSGGDRSITWTQTTLSFSTQLFWRTSIHPSMISLNQALWCVAFVSCPDRVCLIQSFRRATTIANLATGLLGYRSRKDVMLFKGKKDLIHRRVCIKINFDSEKSRNTPGFIPIKFASICCIHCYRHRVLLTLMYLHI